MTKPIDRVLEGIVRGSVPLPERDAEQVRFGFVTNPDAASLINRACAARNVSVNALLTRAAVAMSCSILGEDYYTFAYDAQMPPPRAYFPAERLQSNGSVKVQRSTIPEDQPGTAGGPWRITGLD